MSAERQPRKRGFDVLRDKELNRSIAFSRRERERLGLRGLLPHRVSSMRPMVERVMENLGRLPREKRPKDVRRHIQALMFEP